MCKTQTYYELEHKKRRIYGPFLTQDIAHKFIQDVQTSKVCLKCHNPNQCMKGIPPRPQVTPSYTKMDITDDDYVAEKRDTPVRKQMWNADSKEWREA
jgi:hypothetical protein